MSLANNVFHEIPIPPKAIVVKESAILNWLGYTEEPIEPYIKETIQKFIHTTQYLLAPKGGIIIKELISNSGSELSVQETSFNTGKIIAGQLKHAEKLAFFITTIGSEIEKLSNELFNRNEMLEGYIVNLIGSEAAEACAEYIHKYVAEEMMLEDLNVTNRFSPGYCNWDVSQQFLLFSQFPKKFDYVKLTESALMQPVKSVSGILGIGSRVKYRDYKCALCTDEKCIYRKRK
jgi:hypothetical protein